MNEDINKAHILEQGEAGSADAARMVAEFYKTLIENGVPKSLAETLTIDWANGVMRSVTPK